MYSIYYPLLSQLFLVVPGPPLLSFLHSLVHLLSILFHHLQPTLQPEVTHAYHNGEWMPDNSLTEIQEAHFHTESTVRQLVHRGQGGSFSHRICCQATCSQRSRKVIFTQNLLSGNLFTEVKEGHFHTESTVRQLVHRGQGRSFSHRIYCHSHRRVLEIQQDILLGLIPVTHSSETLKLPNTAEAILMFHSCLFL